MTVLLLLAPSGFSFALLLGMARYERWALELEADGDRSPEAEPGRRSARSGSRVRRWWQALVSRRRREGGLLRRRFGAGEVGG